MSDMNPHPTDRNEYKIYRNIDKKEKKKMIKKNTQDIDKYAK